MIRKPRTLHTSDSAACLTVLPQQCVDKQSVVVKYQCSLYKRTSVEGVEILFIYKKFFVCIVCVSMCVGLDPIRRNYKYLHCRIPVVPIATLKCAIYIHQVHYTPHKTYKYPSCSKCKTNPFIKEKKKQFSDMKTSCK
jgi:hypothetical protein